MTSVFDFIDYKKYLIKFFHEKQKMGKKGLRSRLAEALSCQSAYISRVLGGTAHFSLEQADVVNKFCGHQLAECEFFFLLVQHARAGTQSMKLYFHQKMLNERELRLNLKQRLEVKDTISKSDEVLYFSRWQNAAIHVALLVPSLQSKEEIAKRLSLPLAQVSEIIEFLISLGLISTQQGKFISGTKRLHLGKDSPILTRHHVNWRLHAVNNIEKTFTDGLHYSSVISLSHEDLTKIKEIMVKAIENAKSVIKVSPEETLAAFCIDLYEF